MPIPSKNQSVADQLKRQRPQWVEAPLRTIDFQHDTIPLAGKAYGSFTPEKNIIAVSIKEGDDAFNSDSQSLATLAHEQKHRDNHLQGADNLNMSLEQHYKIECIDEISAKICELLQWREQYINAKTDEERQAIVDHPSTRQFSYYFNAINQGTINPFSTNSKEMEEEMRFIGQETQKMWMEHYAPKYDKTNTHKSKYYFRSNEYKDLKTNDINYSKARQIMLGNIGGIDFTKYIQDIDCHNDYVKRISRMVEDNASSFIIKNAFEQLENPSQQSQTLEKFFTTYERDSKDWKDNGGHDPIEKLKFNNGAPEYDTNWSPNHRVSDIKYQDVYDFTKPFLRERLEQAKQKETQAAANSTAETIMMLRGLRSQETTGAEKSSNYQRQISLTPQIYQGR